MRRCLCVSLLALLVKAAFTAITAILCTRRTVLRHNLRLKDEVIFLLDTLYIEHLEGHEDEAKDEQKHVRNKVQTVHPW